MTITINASTSSGLVVTPDNSGSINIQANGVTAFSISASGIVTMPNQPAFYAATNQGSSNQGATIVWNQAFLNRGNILNTSTGIFTVPVTGIYSLQSCVRFNNAGITYVQSYMAKNGTDSLAIGNTNSTLGNPTYTASLISATVLLTAGDTVRVYTQSSANNNQSISGSESWFSGCLIG
tara:strand:+ start:109 stop:645 length:537 start_codon:yes stop_codon:yes gene_type:complete